MKNFDRRGLMDLEDEARRVGPASEEMFQAAGFIDVHQAFDKNMLNEARSDSEMRLMEDPVNQAIEAYSEIDPKFKSSYRKRRFSKGFSYGQRKKMLQQAEEQIKQAQAKFPDAGLKSFSDILAETKEKTAGDRESAMRTFANARGMARAGMLTGSMTGVITDPLILATLPIGAGTITGAGVLGNAARAFRLEAMIAGASELAIQPTVYNWKKQIESPYTFGEAAFNVLTAMAAAGTLRATGSTLVDVVEIRSAAKIKRAEGGKLADQEADILEQYADDLETGGDNVTEHFDNLDTALDDLDRGETTAVSRRSEHVEEVDPFGIDVDANRFQFKAGADELGVTERLQGVQRWDPKLAGIAIVYETNTGRRFIVDGHQRVSLARRMVDAGQDPAEVKLNAIVLREADGVTDADARQIAAVKNIAEGTGSAVDTAKVFRELGESGLDLMPSLPPKSALVVAGRGLSNLDDEAFKMVINGVVDEKVGAIVGELITDAAEQRAVITALAQAEPANLTQARIMINDMKAAGFQRTETEDLFGGMEIAESLFKERARILDNSMKRLRQDKATFATLERKAGEIEAEGNILDQQANLARKASDEQTLAELTRLANRKGPISDALNQAAKELKEGKTISQSTADFLDAARRPGPEQRAAGAGAGGAGPAEQAVKGKPPFEGAPPMDRPVTLIFGGSFNPVHSGHIGSVLAARAQMEAWGYTVERVVITPSPERLMAAKAAKKGETPLSLEDRAELVRIAVRDETGLEVSTAPAIAAEKFEGKLKRIHTAQWAEKEYPDNSIVNVTGADQAVGEPPAFPSVYQGPKGSSHEGYYYLAMPRDEVEGVSSSKVRAMLQAGEEIPEDVMKPEVAQRYLMKQKLIPGPKILPPENAPFKTEILDHGKGPYVKVILDRDKVDIDADYFGYPDLEPTLKEGDDLLIHTNEKYQNPKTGKYQAHRSRLHNKLVREAVDKGKVAKDNEQPEIILMGGGGASGKGTILSKLQDDGEVAKDGWVHIDPDEVKKALPEYKKIQDAGDYRAAGVVHAESSHVGDLMRDLAIKERRNVIIDKVMGQEAKGLALIQKFKDAGYKVRLIGVTIDPEEALFRALERYYGTGRLPLPEHLVLAHKGFNEAYPAYAKVVDEALIYDNTAAGNPIAVAQAFDGKVEILSNSLYNRIGERSNLNAQAKTIRQVKESTGSPVAAQLRREGVQGTPGASPVRGDGGARGPPAGADNLQRVDEPVLDLFGEDTRAAQAIHDARVAIERELNPDDVVPVEAGPGDLFSGKSRQVDIEDEVDRLIYERDLDVPEGILVDADGNLTASARSAREVYDEIDETAKALDELEGCHLGKVA